MQCKHCLRFYASAVLALPPADRRAKQDNFPLRISYTCALFYYKRRIEHCFPILRIMKTIVGFSVRVW